MKFEDLFDSVVMLTWSNWATEPRSNRFHYATRFAKELPTFFVQPNRMTINIVVEDSGYDGLKIVNCSAIYGREQENALIDFLRESGCKRPLIWVYNPKFSGMLSRFDNSFSVFHATEDFTHRESQIVFFSDEDREAALSTIAICDLLVCVSDAVRANYQEATSRTKPSITLPNGCDFAYWFNPALSIAGPKESDRPIAFFQGGLNVRVDFDLLYTLVLALPDWDFWFAGSEDLRESMAQRMAKWTELKTLSNVKYFGVVDIVQLRDLTYRSTVGLIPFIKDPVIAASLPLKAYEYIAAGLGVVSVPIPSIEHEPAISIQSDAAGFAVAMHALLPTRLDLNALKARELAASLMNYDIRFSELKTIVSQVATKLYEEPKQSLNILMLYCDQFTHIKTIEENLKAFKTYSKHNYYYLACSDYPGWNMMTKFEGQWPNSLDLSVFDAICWHYGMPASLAEYFSLVAGEQLTRFDGLKILFIQDEYENTATIGEWVKKAGIQLVMTCVPKQGVDYVYPEARTGKTEFIQTLTGFVPNPSAIAAHSMPIEERQTIIGYRGRVLPYHYGTLGWEKFQIGLKVREEAAKVGLKVDIEVDDSKRIYGVGWYKFLGSVRATLGTESGANVFDFDGSLKAKAAAAREAGIVYEDFYEENIREREGFVQMNQVSPKFFEAIILRTALVCFEGTYSGVIKPDLHFISLAKDFSNLDDVFAKLNDLDYLKELTDRAYRDVIESGAYSYAKFMSEFDQIIESRTLRQARTEIISAPMATRRRGAADFSLLIHKDPMEFALNDGVLRQPLRRQEIVQGMTEVRAIENDKMTSAALGSAGAFVMSKMQ